MTDNTQWICQGKKCKCSREEYTCDCQPLVIGRGAHCKVCRRPLTLIDTDTGATVVQAQETP